MKSPTRKLYKVALGHSGGAVKRTLFILAASMREAMTKARADGWVDAWDNHVLSVEELSEKVVE